MGAKDNCKLEVALCGDMPVHTRKACGERNLTALAAGMKEKAAEFVATGAEIYQGPLPEGVTREH